MRSVSAWPTECLDEVVPERSESRFLMCLRRSVVAAPARPERSKASGWNDVLSSSAALNEALKRKYLLFSFSSMKWSSGRERATGSEAFLEVQSPGGLVTVTS